MCTCHNSKALIFPKREETPEHLVDATFKFRGEVLQMVQVLGTDDKCMEKHDV